MYIDEKLYYRNVNLLVKDLEIGEKELIFVLEYKNTSFKDVFSLLTMKAKNCIFKNKKSLQFKGFLFDYYPKSIQHRFLYKFLKFIQKVSHEEFNVDIRNLKMIFNGKHMISRETSEKTISNVLKKYKNPIHLIEDVMQNNLTFENTIILEHLKRHDFVYSDEFKIEMFWRGDILISTKIPSTIYIVTLCIYHYLQANGVERYNAVLNIRDAIVGSNSEQEIFENLLNFLKDSNLKDNLFFDVIDIKI